MADVCHQKTVSERGNNSAVGGDISSKFGLHYTIDFDMP